MLETCRVDGEVERCSAPLVVRGSPSASLVSRSGSEMAWPLEIGQAMAGLSWIEVRAIWRSLEASPDEILTFLQTLVSYKSASFYPGNFAR